MTMRLEGEECVLWVKGFKRVKYSSFIIESQSIISKTKESRTISITVFRNTVANSGKTSERSGK